MAHEQPQSITLVVGSKQGAGVVLIIVTFVIVSTGELPFCHHEAVARNHLHHAGRDGVTGEIIVGCFGLRIHAELDLEGVAHLQVIVYPIASFSSALQGSHLAGELGQAGVIAG